MHAEWWRQIFNSTYLKTDGDVVGVDARRASLERRDELAKALDWSSDEGGKEERGEDSEK